MSQQNNVPRVSVIMSVFNTDVVYLREAIDSVLNQTYKSYELIVIDDGSDSYIEKIVREYLSDPRIRYIRLEENSGNAHARNIGIQNSQGEYIAILDSDDVAYPDRIRKQVDYLDNHTDIGVLGTYVDTNEYDNNGAVYFNRCNFPSSTVDGEIKLHLLFKGNMLCHSTIMYRKSVLTSANIFYNENFRATVDYCIYLELASLTNFAVLNETLGLYRSYGGNVSHKMNHVQKTIADCIQLKYFEQYFSIKFTPIETYIFYLIFRSKTYYAKLISFEEIDSFTKKLIGILKLRGIDDVVIDRYFGERYRNLFHILKGIRNQFSLFRSFGARYFHIPFHWKLFYFLKKGLF